MRALPNLRHLALATFVEGIRHRALWAIVCLAVLLTMANIFVAQLFTWDLGKVSVEFGLSSVALTGHAAQPARQQQGLASGEVIVKKRKLGEVADAVAVLLLADLMPQYPQAAAAGTEKMEQQFDGSRFAGAVWSEKTKGLVLPHGQGKPVQGLVAPAVGAEGFADVVDFDDWSGHAQCRDILIGCNVKNPDRRYRSGFSRFQNIVGRLLSHLPSCFRCAATGRTIIGRVTITIKFICSIGSSKGCS